MYINSAILMFYVAILSFRHSLEKMCDNLGIYGAKLKAKLEVFICWLRTSLVAPVEN